MGIRFRKSFRLFPGVKVNVSKSGVSTSIGGAPFTVNVGKRGIMQTISLPGTGLSWRKQSKIGSHARQPNSQQQQPMVRPGFVVAILVLLVVGVWLAWPA